MLKTNYQVIWLVHRQENSLILSLSSKNLNSNSNLLMHLKITVTNIWLLMLRKPLKLQLLPCSLDSNNSSLILPLSVRFCNKL